MRAIPAWGIGRVTDDGLAASEAVEFAESDWDLRTIRQRFRAAVDSFGPDYVVISDAWNMKPHLAESMRGYPTILLMQAQECLCPLNNLRLLGAWTGQGGAMPSQSACHTPGLPPMLGRARAAFGRVASGGAGAAGVGTADYDSLLRQSFQDAEAVLSAQSHHRGDARAFCQTGVYCAVGN